MADIDYDALAAKYGGSDAKPQAGAVDYDALATQYGGTTPQTRLQGADEALRKAATGGVEAGVNLASGVLAGPVSGIAGLVQGAKNLVSPGMSAGDRVNQVQEALTFEPRTEAGQSISGAIAAPFAKVAQVADRAGDYVSDVTGSPALGAGFNTAVQSIPAVASRGLSPAAQRKLLLERERADVLSRANAPQAEAILAARERGLTLPPAEANPTILNRMLEGVSGQAKVQQLASAKNQPIVQNIVRKGLGIREDVPVTIDALEAVRKGAGETYEKVRNVGEVPIDGKYGAALDKIVKDYEGASKSFVEETSAVQKAVDSARNTVKAGVFDADSAVSKIKLERRRADTAFRQGDAELGKAHKAIADAIEDQIERHLSPTGSSAIGGKAGLLDELRQSRTLIAQSYDVQKALKANGEIDARVLAGQLRKRPMTGEIAEVAKIAGKFPGAFQAGSRNAYTSTNYGDVLMGAGAGGATLMKAAALDASGLGGAALAAAAATAARPAIRSGITSGAGQRFLVKPKTFGSMTPELAAILASDPAAAAAAGLQPHGFRTLEEELR